MKEEEKKNESVERENESQIVNEEESEKKQMEEEIEKEVKMTVEELQNDDVKDDMNEISMQLDEISKDLGVNDVMDEKKEENETLCLLEKSLSSLHSQSNQDELQKTSLNESPLSMVSMSVESSPLPQKLAESPNTEEDFYENRLKAAIGEDLFCESLPLFPEEPLNVQIEALADSSSIHSNHSQEISSLDISPIEENRCCDSKTPSPVSREEIEVLSQLFPPSETKNRCVIRHNIVFSESDTASTASLSISPKPIAASSQGELKSVSSPIVNEKDAEHKESNELQKNLFVTSEEEEEEEEDKHASESVLDDLSVTVERGESSNRKESVESHSVHSQTSEKPEVESISFDLPISSEVTFVFPMLSDKSTEVLTLSDKPTEVQTVSRGSTEVLTISQKPTEVLTISDKPSEVQTVSDKPSEVQTVYDKPSEVLTVSDKPSEVQSAPENAMEVESHIEAPIEIHSTLESTENPEKQSSTTQECSSPVHQTKINPQDLITPPRSSLKRPIQITQESSILDGSKIVSVAVPRPPEEFVTPKKKQVVATTVSPTKVVDESDFMVEENSVQEKDQNEDRVLELSIFSPLGGRKIAQSSRIKRLLRELEGERNRFRSQFRLQIQGLLDSFKEDQNHVKSVDIVMML